MRRLVLALALGLGLVGIVAAAPPVAAHTGFEASEPADGAQVDESVAEVTLRFTGTAEPVGSGFEVLRPDGQMVVPDASSSGDGTVWTLAIDPPLERGTAGVRWQVKAPDAHPISGAFSFTAGGSSADGSEQLAGFLDAGDDSSPLGSAVSFTARALGIVAALVSVGGLAFAATVLRGRDRDLLEVAFWVRRAGVVLVGAAVLEALGLGMVEAGGSLTSLAADPSALLGALGGSSGIAVGLRAAGGVALMSGTKVVAGPASAVADPLVPVAAMANAVPVGRKDSERGSVGVGAAYEEAHDLAWRLDPGSRAALVGALVVVTSFAFDGHTASKGSWAVTALFDVVHVAAAAVWVGGVSMLAAVAWHRSRRGEPIRAAHLAVRFSVVASVALVAVGMAGLVLSVVVLDSPGELIGTPWGRLLLLKLLVVGAAAAAGAYNHKMLIPELEGAPDDVSLSRHFRNVVTVETGLLVTVGVITAWLVGAAS